MMNSPCPAWSALNRSARANALALVLPGALLIGCALPKSPPEVASDRYAGPPGSLVVIDGRHALRLTCPSPGWKVHLDQERREWQRLDAYITLERPSPLYVYPQVVTSQDVMTSAKSEQPVRVLVRVVDPGGTSGAYRIMAESIGSNPAP